MRETLTTKENILARINNEQAKLYQPEKLLTINEQVKLDVFSSMNEYIKVGSTVEAPVLNEYNILYRVDGIDDTLLFDVLQSHAQASRRIDVKKEASPERADKKDTEPFVIFETDFDDIHEQRAHTKYGNFLMKTIDIQGIDDEGLGDKVGHNTLNQRKVNAKLDKLQKDIMFNLDNLWKDYHHRVDEKKAALGDRYVQCERAIKSTFNKIKGLERLKQKLEDQLEDLYYRKNIKPQMDILLSRFVDWQQRQIAIGHEPSMTWEEAIIQLQPRFKRYLDRYERGN